MEYELNVTIHGICLIRLYGRIDHTLAEQLRQDMNTFMEQGQRWFILDLSQVTFLESMGLTVLITGIKSARVIGGDLVVIQPTPNVRNLLHITALDYLIREYPTVQAAIAAYQQAAQNDMFTL
ncbi:MAG: STAS domain-containing protein [Chloroflexaceae bacterium]|nr:STAS domain-containing protein [Chloroflexaceae bacterium]